ncbi:acyl transferase/acyl hydrolase/lysophospholipase [Flagelloscypha sp. PMI_526]|nr:acyl transferase/acyl hydrolase/lysophospholipase [Flagelloscypha sp. PMI_526]
MASNTVTSSSIDSIPASVLNAPTSPLVFPTKTLTMAASFNLLTVVLVLGTNIHMNITRDDAAGTRTAAFYQFLIVMGTVYSAISERSTWYLGELLKRIPRIIRALNKQLAWVGVLSAPISIQLPNQPQLERARPAAVAATNIKVLSLDGGGVFGLAEMFVLQEVFRRLEFDLHYEVKPCQIFDVIAGVGTGGLVAILLGRLGLAVQEAIKAYIEIFRAVYTESINIRTIAEKTSSFERILQAVILRYTGKSDTRMLPDNSSPTECKTFVCAMPAHNFAHPRLFRSYRVRKNQSHNCTIWEASRASTATPSIFSEILIGPSFQEEPFVDASLRCNNPTQEVVHEIKENYGNVDISCLVSMGAGKNGVVSLKNCPLEHVLLKIALNGKDASDSDFNCFDEGLPGTRPYWRFNVEQGMQGTTCEEWGRVSEMITHVNSYLVNPEVSRRIDSLVEVLRNSYSHILICDE